MGSDERAAYTSGVRIDIVRVGAHIIAGIFAGLATVTCTSLIASGDPTQGTTYTLIAVTALEMGGANLAGGAAALSARCSVRSTFISLPSFSRLSASARCRTLSLIYRTALCSLFRCF